MGEGRAGAEPLQFQYDGTLGELYRIFLVNLALTVVTLGVYRFWAKTRTRRYLWSHMRFMGDRLEYTGTGGEKFRGFALAMLLLIGLGAVHQGIQIAVRSYGLEAVQLAEFPLGLLYGALFGTAVYAAQRYRLSRTSWRGIRGGMQPGAFAFGMRALGYYFLAGVTLGLTWPVWRTRMLQQRINASSFGSAGFAAALRGGALYPAYIATWLVLGGALAAIVVVALAVDKAQGGHAQVHSLAEFSIWHWLVVIVVGLLFLGGMRTLLAWVDAALARQALTALRLADLRFDCTITGGRLFRLRAGNLLIWLGTLGLGAPIVTQRNARFLAQHVQVLGTLDSAALRQSPLVPPRRGEGLMEAFDVGIAG